MENYKYFISFNFQNGNDWGFGNAFVDFDREIIDMTDIDEIESAIKKDSKRKIIISNFKLIKGE